MCKDRENILFEEVHMEKTKSINSHRLSIKSKEDKHKSIGSVMDTLMSGIFFSSGLTVINPSPSTSNVISSAFMYPLSCGAFVSFNVYVPSVTTTFVFSSVDFLIYTKFIM